MKKPKAFYIKRKDRKIIIRFTTKLRRPYKTYQQWGIFIVFGKHPDWTRYY